MLEDRSSPGLRWTIGTPRGWILLPAHAKRGLTCTANVPSGMHVCREAGVYLTGRSSAQRRSVAMTTIASSAEPDPQVVARAVGEDMMAVAVMCLEDFDGQYLDSTT